MRGKVAIFLSILVVFVAVGCSTTSNFSLSGVSNTEADYALHYALKTACTKATTKLRNQLPEIDFIPDSYSELKDNVSVPGLPTLLKNLQDYYSDYINSNIQSVEDYVLFLSDSVKFKEPIELVKKSNKSASSYLILRNREEIEEKFAEIMKDADSDVFDSCINQYNSYVLLSNIQNKTKTNTYSMEDINPYISEKLTALYLELLQTSEEFYRTTPDPYADQTAAKVFGIN